MQYIAGILAIFFFIWLWKTAPVIVILGLLALFLWIFFAFTENRRNFKLREEKIASMTPDELEIEQANKKEEILLLQYGPCNQHLICPHCQTKGLVRATQKTLNSVATGHVGGILKTNTKTTSTSIVTQHHCCQCETTWTI